MAVDEWDQRQLCPDETCIGVIGNEGTCKVCGRVAPNWGDERRRGLTPLPPDAPTDLEEPASADDASDDDDDDDDDDDLADDDDGADDVEDPDPDWDRRKLCTDGACIGVIGPSGACNTCGKRAAG